VLRVLVSSEPALPGEGWIGSWSPGIGDPTPMGWLTVALYFVAAFQCFRIARGRRARLVGREAILWYALAACLFALGVNKQLDLQSALTEAGRMLSNRGGWYESRRELQRAFIVQMVVLLAIALGVLGWLVRRAPLATRAALGGALLLGAFVVIRAASFHKVDMIIHASFLGIRANWVLEIGGILIVLAAAVWRLRSAVPREPSARPR